MAIYRNDPVEAAQGQKELTDINQAVRDHNTGALQKMLDEVNTHDSLSQAGPRFIYNQLSPDAQRAITPTDAEGRNNGFSPTHLDISNIWKNESAPKSKVDSNPQQDR
jgi:hypothetical protein